MPQFPGVGNQIDQPIYDTMQAAAATGQTLSFYSVPVGGAFTAAITKDFRHTNLVQAGRLEKNVSADVFAFSWAVKNTINAGTVLTLADYRILMNTSHLNFQVGQVSFLRLPGLLCPPGPAESSYFSNITPAATEFNLNHGLASVANMFMFENTIHLDPQETINVDVFIGGAVAAVQDIQVVLWATQFRPAR